MINNNELFEYDEYIMDEIEKKLKEIEMIKEKLKECEVANDKFNKTIEELRKEAYSLTIKNPYSKYSSKIASKDQIKRYGDSYDDDSMNYYPKKGEKNDN